MNQPPDIMNQQRAHSLLPKDYTGMQYTAYQYSSVIFLDTWELFGRFSRGETARRAGALSQQTSRRVRGTAFVNQLPKFH